MDQQLSQHSRMRFEKKTLDGRGGKPTLIKMESASHRDQRATRVLLLVIMSRRGL